MIPQVKPGSKNASVSLINPLGSKKNVHTCFEFSQVKWEHSLLRHDSTQPCMSISVCLDFSSWLEKLQSVPVVTLYHDQKKSFFFWIKINQYLGWKSDVCNYENKSFFELFYIVTWLRLNFRKAASCSAIIHTCNISQSSISSCSWWVMKRTRLIVQKILVVSASSCVRAHCCAARIVNSICIVQDILVRELTIISPYISSRWIFFPVDLTLKINNCVKILKYLFSFYIKILFKSIPISSWLSM